jgi:O-antigen/teichoic acid export membrane protein
MMALFVLTPVTLQRAGLTTYGLFVALSAFAGLLAFSDLGLANGLMQRLSVARATGDRTVAVSALTNTLALLSFIGVVLAGAGAAIALQVPWSETFNAPASREDDLTQAAVVIAVCIGLGIPAGIATKVFMGLLQPATGSLWTMAATVSSGGLVALAAGGRNALPLMVAAQVGVPSLFGFLALAVAVRQNSLLGFDRRTLQIRPTLALMRDARLFVFLQVAVVLSYQVDALVLVRLLGPEEAAVFATTIKFISLPLGLATFFFFPLWPAFAEAAESGDLAWIKKNYYRAIRSGLLISVVAAPACMVFGQPLVTLWTRGLVEPPLLLIAAGAVWIMLSLYSQPQSMLLNGLHVEGLQLKTVSLTVVANLILSVLLTMQIGVSGPLLGTIISLFLLTTLPSTLWVSRHFKKRSALTRVAD